MKQTLIKKIRLRVLMLVAVLCAGFTSAWGDEVVAYTLTPASGSNNGYANNCDITISNITWNLTGNSTVQPWRIGGKSLSGVDRTLYSKTAIADNISKIEVTHGAASSITVNSWTVIVASDADFNNVVSTLTPTFTANSTTTITRPEGKDWSNCYYKFVYNVTVSGSSNKFIEFSKATFYKESGSSDPIQLSAPELAATANNGSVTLEWNEINNASSYTIQYADNASFTGATTVTDATSPQEISGLTNGTTYYFKAMTVGDGTNYLSSDYGDAVSATPANVSKITITQDNLTDFTNEYKWYDWTAGGVSGSAYAYKNVGMQFNSSKDGYWIYNTSAIPGTITSVKMVKASGTDRSWTLKAGTSEIASTNDGEEIGEAQTVGTSGATWNVNGSYNYFCLIVSGGSTVIQSIEITYIPSTDPIIVASDPSELAYDATGGEFDYSITNPTSATLSATSNADWITNVTVDGSNSKVTFNTTANPNTTQRTGTITLSYTGADDKVVTITQAAAPVIYTTIPALFDAATSTETEVNVNFGGWVVSAVHNSNAYLTDNQGHGLIIYASGHGFQVNDVLTGTVSCKLMLYRGSAELTNLTTSTEGLTVTQNGTVTAQTIAISELGGVNTGALLSFEGLTYNGTALVDGNSKTITPYNSLYSEMSFEKDKSYDVTGIYVQYNDTKEILPRSAADIEEVQVQHQDYDLTVTLNDNVSAIYVFDATDDTNPLIADGAAGTVQVADATQVLVSPDVASGYALGSLTVDGVDVTEQMNEGSYTFTMPTHAVTITATAVPVKTYTLASSITSGKHYIIVNNEAGRAMGEQASNNRQAGGVTISGQTASVASEANVVEFVIYGPDADGYYTIYDAAEGGYLYAASSSSNQLKTQTTNDDNGRWSISFGEGGVASIVAQGDKERNVMQYNSSSKLFACYGSASQQPVYLYEKAGEATPTESVTVGTVGYATFASNNALDFTESDIKAFYATVSGSELTFTQITKVPANTGVLLYKDGGATVDIPALTGDADETTDNVFVRGTGASVTWAENDQKYVLFNGDDGIGFYKANNNNVATNRAYVQVPAGTQVKSFAINLDDTDAIGAIKAVNDNADIFNLAGQRVNKAQKGIYIINGKKVLVK